ncbi:MAG: glycerol-3-phosphate dehydrogenase/oxidase [Actinomycetota bacterium]
MKRGLGARADALTRLSDASPDKPLDLLVVGGGVTGAGIALDAASRGMNVGLVERFDFASGTSSKSSKLIHGGLRYLEQREFGLVREASAERDLMRRLAPHLVEPIPFVLPVTSRRLRAKMGVGLWAYDALATMRNLHVHRRVDPAEIEELLPPLPRAGLKGGFLFYDAKTDDVRLVMEILLQARRHGAVVVNYAPVLDLSGSEQECSATVEDKLTGDTFEVKARKVVVAAGVWTDTLESMAQPEAEARLRPSKGIHLTFRPESLPVTNAAALIPDLERRRMLFVIPWLDCVLVGTTDTAYEGDLDRPTVDDDDRKYCLDAVNAAFELSLTDDEIAGAYAGLRPLIAGRAGATADLSRRHAVYDIAPGVLGITGGKLTTWRRMAKDATDRVSADLGVSSKSKTRWIRLGSDDLIALSLAVDRRASRLAIPETTAANLIRCYGDRALDVLDLAAQKGLAGPLVAGHPLIAAEAPYCARFEMATHLSDLLARRTRVALTDPGAGIGEASTAPELFGAEHSWSRRRRREEVESHRRAIELERGQPLRATVTATGLDAAG